jgi:hypothetical protein
LFSSQVIPLLKLVLKQGYQPTEILFENIILRILNMKDPSFSNHSLHGEIHLQLSRG